MKELILKNGMIFIIHDDFTPLIDNGLIEIETTEKEIFIIPINEILYYHKKEV